MTRRYLLPSELVGMCMKSMCMYSNGVVALTMYHSGRGMVVPALVLMHDRQAVHIFLICLVRAVSLQLGILYRFVMSAAVAVADRWK